MKINLNKTACFERELFSLFLCFLSPFYSYQIKLFMWYLVHDEKVIPCSYNCSLSFTGYCAIFGLLIMKRVVDIWTYEFSLNFWHRDLRRDVWFDIFDTRIWWILLLVSSPNITELYVFFFFLITKWVFNQSSEMIWVS